jgi:hypothetical protein
MIRQISWDLLDEELEPHALLGKSPSFFEKERDVAFTSGLDDLDYFLAALFMLNEATVFALKRYRGNPKDTTTIFLSPRLRYVDEITRIIAAIVQDLDLSEADILWQRKDTPQRWL